MKRRTTRALGTIVLTLSATACVAIEQNEGTSDDALGRVSDGQIIGNNDLVVVVNDGANIPSKYKPLLDAFGRMSVGCTATHVGNGIVLTAGHCFNLGAKVTNKACSGTVAWGRRADKTAYLTSSCTTILAGEVSGGRDWAIFKVSPVPPVAVEVDLARAPAGTPLTIFGHPQGRPLEWSTTCSLISAGSGGRFNHTCDTEPGNSGSTILDDTTLKVVGIHDGAIGNQNYGTYISSTPFASLVGGGNDAGPPPPPPPPPSCTASESEPNDVYSSPNALAGTICGSVASSDIDWFTWAVGTTPTPYKINLAATGDAKLDLWKLVDGTYHVIASDTPTSYDKTSNGAGTYVLSVRSPSGTSQTYSLSLAQ